MAIDPDGDGEATETETTESGLSQTQTVDRSGEHAAHPPVDKLEKGTPLGRYLILETLGKGGMGVVYSAYDPELDRKVALKLVRGAGDGTGGSRESAESTLRLMREAQAMAKVVHPNVVTVHEVGTWHGRVFLAMERVDGPDLKEWLNQKPRSWEEVLAVFVAAGQGLAAAHDAGLVHRDFKPENVLVGKDGRPKVTDFGLVRQAGDAAVTRGSQGSTPIEATAVTQAGVVMGTPAFMAPEQMEGLAATPAADQFSFAVSLWLALYLQKPFAGQTMQEIHREIEKGRLLPAPPGVKAPRYLSKVLARALAYAPGERYGSIAELLAALENDPQLKLKRLMRGVGLAAAVLALPGWLAVRELRHAHRCEHVGEELAGVWDGARRTQLQQHLTSLGDEARAEAPFTLKWLDTYANAWLRQRTDACNAELAGDEDPRRTASRNACVARRRVKLRASVDALLTADADAVRVARLSFSRLGMVKTCEGTAAQEKPGEADKEALPIQEEISRAELSALLGRAPLAQGQLQQTAERAKALGQHRLASEAYAALAHGYDDRSGRPEVVTFSKLALLEAEASHEDEQVFDTELSLARALAYGPGAYDEALWCLDQAEAITVRLALPPERQSLLYSTRADVLEQASRMDEARAPAQKGYDLLASVATDEFELVQPLMVLANVISDQGDIVGSEPLYEKLLALQEREGLSLEETRHTQLYLGEELVLLGRYSESLDHFEKAFTPGGSHWKAVDNAAGAAWEARALAQLGDFERARQKVELAEGERPALLRPESIAEVLLQRQKVELWEGRYDALNKSVDEQRRVLEPVAEVNHSSLLEARLTLVEGLRRQGKLSEARDELQPVVGSSTGLDPVEAGYLASMSALLKLQQGEAVPDAEKIFGSALAAVEKLEGPRSPDRLLMLMGLGLCRGRSGDAAGARAALEQAVTQANAAPGDRYAVAEASRALAQALRDSDPARSAELEEIAKKNFKR